jgi:hypothetical protein
MNETNNQIAVADKEKKMLGWLNTNQQSSSIKENFSSTSCKLISLVDNEQTVKKSRKIIKNGYVDRLSKLLNRQGSAVNFIKHNLDRYKLEPKDAADKETDKLLKHDTVKILIVDLKFIWFNQFCLVKALDLTNDRLEQQQHLTYLLISNQNLFGLLREKLIRNETIVTIYPPWSRIYLESVGHDVYFGANLLEINDDQSITPTLKSELEGIKSVDLLIDFKSFKCPACSNENAIDCDLNLFQVEKIFKFKSNKTKKEKTTIPTTILIRTQSTASSSSSISSTQCLIFNSIVYAIEQAGYCGFVTFRATVARVDFISSSQILLSQHQQSQSNSQSIKFVLKKKHFQFLRRKFKLI